MDGKCPNVRGVQLGQAGRRILRVRRAVVGAALRLQRMPKGERLAARKNIKLKCECGKCYRCYQRSYRRATRTAPGYRICQGKCGKRKRVSEFYRAGRTRLDGTPCYKAECIECHRARQQAKRELEKAGRESLRERDARRARDIPGMKFSYCPHSLPLGSWPCMQCAVARRAIVELTD